MTQVFVGAGSNMEPARHLRTALAALEEYYGPLRISPAYRNKAIGFEGADFINLVVAFDTRDAIETLTRRLKEIEHSCGRVPGGGKRASHTMDLDILLYGDQVVDRPGLAVPRPELLQRAYLLRSMADIAPELVHPVLQRTMRELWGAFQGEPGERVLVDIEKE